MRARTEGATWRALRTTKLLTSATGRRARRVVLSVYELTRERECALAVKIGAGLGYEETALLMQSVSDHDILCAPWLIATDLWMAVQLGDRPALPADGPVLAVKTEIRLRPNSGYSPQTVVELRDTSRKTVLARAKVSLCTAPEDYFDDNQSGPTILRFDVFKAAADDDSLVEAAGIADLDRPRTQRALTDTAAKHGAAEANLLAARVLLWRGVEEFCASHVDPHFPYMWPLRASPTLLGKHGPFFAWRGMTIRRPLSQTRAMLTQVFGGGGGWPYLRLGAPEDPDDPRSTAIEEWREPGAGGSSDEDVARHKALVEAAEAAHIRVAAHLLQE